MARKTYKYETSVFVGYKTVNGEQKAIRKHIYADTKQEFEKKKAEIKHLKFNGHNLADDNTFGYWANRWFATKENNPDIGNSTVLQHKSNIEILNSRFENEKLKNIKADHFNNFLYEIQHESPISHRPLSHESLRKITVTAHCVFKYAIGNDVPIKDFFAKELNLITIPKGTGEKKRRALSEEEQQRIIDTPHRAQLPAMIMLFAGLRRGEVCGLMWKDIDFDKGTLTVARSVDLRTGEIKDGGKTDNAIRVIPIPPILVDYLKEYKATSNGLYVCTDAKGRVYKDMGFRRLWDSYMTDLNIKYGYNGEVDKLNRYDKKRQPAGQYISYRSKDKDENGNYTKLCNRYELPMKIEPFTPHYLRHTYATLLFLEGIPVDEAKQYMGHSDFSTTNEIYQDLKRFNKATLSEEYRAKLNNEFKIRKTA